MYKKEIREEAERYLRTLMNMYFTENDIKYIV